MKKLGTHLNKFIIILLLMLTGLHVNAQISDFNLTIANDVQVSDRILEFDIFLLDKDISAPFELAAVQAGIIVNSGIYNTGTITVSIVAGFSQLSNLNQQPTSIIWEQNKNAIKLTPRPTPGAGYGSIISQSAPGTRICRLRITNTIAFTSSSTANLTFNFTISPYPTKVAQYISGTNTVLTCNSTNTFSNAANIVLNPPVSAPTPIAVTGGGPYCQGSDGLQVGLANSENGVTYTLYKNAIAQIPTVAGTGAVITFGNQLFGTYTVSGTNAGGTTPMTDNAIITEIPTPEVPTASVTIQPTCLLPTGTIVVSAPLGTYEYNIDGGAYQVGTTFAELSPGSYTLTVRLASSPSCVSASSGPLTVNSVPATPAAPNIGSITQPTCALATGSIILTELPEGNWTINPGSIIGSTTSTTFSGLVAATYNFTVTNSDGCTSPASADVVINEQPTTPTVPVVGIITQPTCSVSTGNVALSGLPATGTWTLTRAPDEITTTGTGTSKTVSGITDGTYTYTVTNASGCTSTVSGNFVINIQPVTPTAPIQGTITQPTCELATGSVVLSGLPATGTWIITRTPGGTTNTGTGTGTTVTELATGTYTFTVTNASECTSPPSGSVVINAHPVTPPKPLITSIDNYLESSSGSGNQWYNSSGIIISATEQRYTPSSNGNYYVVVTNVDGCISEASNTISFPTGIEKIWVFEGISIYPNPAKNHLIIENNKFLSSIDFEIVNSNGKKIYNSILNNTSIVDLSRFSSGVYYIRFTKEDSHYVFKFIKQ